MIEPYIHKMSPRALHTDIIMFLAEEFLPVIPFPQTPITRDSVLIQIFSVRLQNDWRQESLIVEFSGRGIASRTSLKLANDFVIFTHLENSSIFELLSKVQIQNPKPKSSNHTRDGKCAQGLLEYHKERKSGVEEYAMNRKLPYVS